MLAVTFGPSDVLMIFGLAFGHRSGGRPHRSNFLGRDLRSVRVSGDTTLDRAFLFIGVSDEGPAIGLARELRHCWVLSAVVDVRVGCDASDCPIARCQE